ncbi:MAG: 2-oxoacid:acceptor oxidoreductase subunit alpha [Dehalococcoidia bacterium]|nr:2-oxoacid:acceptor oxidoreductase subunit alpha [Dehalococcoidia bacterium]
MRMLVQGNQAVFLGAVKAGATFFAGYPISPSSEILVLAAEHAARNSVFKLIQSEDEIGAVNAIMGASLAGAKSFTATSGPGFSLMQEAVGYGHQVEIPTVIVDVQRVGPATGMPTMPAQQDLLQAMHGSSGDYYPLVFYPNSVEECYRYTILAFNAAEESLSPVILLSDAFLGHLIETVDLEAIPVLYPPGIVWHEHNLDLDLVVPGGMAPLEIVSRQRPPLGTGQRAFTGLTHDWRGQQRTADAGVYREWLAGVKKRHQEIAGNYRFYEYIDHPTSDTLLIAFGIVSRVVRPLASRFAIFRPISMAPLLADELREYGRRFKNVVVVEANDGQYAQLVEWALRREVRRVPLLGGRMNIPLIEAELGRMGIGEGLSV